MGLLELFLHNHSRRTYLEGYGSGISPADDSRRVLAYRGKYLWGLIVTALFTAFEVNANHVQMTYYFLFVILFMVIAYLVDAIRNHKLAHFGKATAVCAAGAIIGICIN